MFMGPVLVGVYYRWEWRDQKFMGAVLDGMKLLVGLV